MSILTRYLDTPFRNPAKLKCYSGWTAYLKTYIGKPVKTLLEEKYYDVYKASGDLPKDLGHYISLHNHRKKLRIGSSIIISAPLLSGAYGFVLSNFDLPHLMASLVVAKYDACLTLPIIELFSHSARKVMAATESNYPDLFELPLKKSI